MPSRVWSLYGAQWLQPLANGGKCPGARNREISENRCRGLPPADGKEGVDGSSPSEGSLQRPRKTGSFVFAPTCTSPARSGVESVLEKRVLRLSPIRGLMGACGQRSSYVRRALRNGPAALERPGPGTGKELRCKESVCQPSRRSRSRSTGRPVRPPAPARHSAEEDTLAR
jgi:hypothetical protein